MVKYMEILIAGIVLVAIVYGIAVGLSKLLPIDMGSSWLGASMVCAVFAFGATWVDFRKSVMMKPNRLEGIIKRARAAKQ